jgi:hypothetical protein
MQNYVNLNIDYVNFNRGGGDGGLGGKLSEGLGGGEKGEKGEKNRKSEEIINSGEIVYKTIVIPFYVCLIDMIIVNDLHIKVVDNTNQNQVIGEGKIRKYRLNGAPTDYNMFIEMDNENVYHIKKKGMMMQVKVGGDLYKVILNTLTNMDVGRPGSGGVRASGASGASGASAKKKGWFSWFKCFSGE